MMKIRSPSSPPRVLALLLLLNASGLLSRRKQQLLEPYSGFGSGENQRVDVTGQGQGSCSCICIRRTDHHHHLGGRSKSSCRR
uniref:Putative secreted protein n=1 Tax=Anopheles marajoara TaxID=58244 RepID=A0A2M4CC64_9DIPT